MAIYDLLDSIKDVPTLGRHDNDALKRIFGTNGILDAVNDVRESLRAVYMRSDDAIVKGDYQPLNYYFATSTGIKLASMRMKPISMGVGAAVKGAQRNN
ncbi:ANK_REP_REGION domain-containing protein [Trichonephila clavata]|uniref:ANK_REP_REGION domain-containing protein n=1 Tax=Trichonephila clavata TaxID=2740835 RepID=A0A8X6HYI4_TRICU|nr:ANK_REP_REGION domain-containing protein [Trichonephila clavata]